MSFVIMQNRLLNRKSMAGVALGSSGAGGPAGPRQDDDWPWIWALHDTEVLDWRRGLSKEEIQAQRRLQSQPPAEISRYLMIGDARSASAGVFALEAFCITHVLNMAGLDARGPVDAYEAADIRYKEIAAEDEEGYPLMERHLEDARAFIGEARETGGRCLVHCVAGLNRSGAIVAAEVMLHEGRTLLDVVSQCRRARGNLFLSNRSFQEDLVALARRHSLLGVVPGEEGSVAPWRAPPSETCPKAASEPSQLKSRRKPVKPLAQLYDG